MLQDNLDSVEVTEDEIKELLARPKDFGYWGGREELFKTWALGPVIETRDSSILEKANAKALKNILESHADLEKDWDIESCSHFAVGWVDHLSFRVVEDDGKTPTKVCKVITDFLRRLEDYPLADEELHSEMEFEATLDSISESGRYVKEDAGDEWQGRILSYLWENNIDIDDGYVDEDQVRDAALELGIADVDYCFDYGNDIEGLVDYYIKHKLYKELREFISDENVLETIREERLDSILERATNKLNSIVAEGQLTFGF